MGNEKKSAVSAAILAKVAGGMSIREAVDAVLGAGTSAALVSDIYDALRAKAVSA